MQPPLSVHQISFAPVKPLLDGSVRFDYIDWTISQSCIFSPWMRARPSRLLAQIVIRNCLQPQTWMRARPSRLLLDDLHLSPSSQPSNRRTEAEGPIDENHSHSGARNSGCQSRCLHELLVARAAVCTSGCVAGARVAVCTKQRLQRRCESLRWRRARQVAAAVRVSDGMVVVVDAVDGLMLNTERVIRQAAPL